MTHSKSALVSIVMATFNGAKFLQEQLDSLRSQTHSHLEIIISDDGSTDETFAILQKIAKNDARFRVQKNKKRLGVIANFLTAAQSARGDYIGWCDQDDIWQPSKISRLLELLQDPVAMLACSDLKVCDENLQTTASSFWKRSGNSPWSGKIDNRIFFKNFSPGCSMIFKREVLEKMKGIEDAPFMHDHLALVLSAGLGEIRLTWETLVNYRQHARNVIGTRASTAFNESEFLHQLARRLDFFEKHWGQEDWFDYEAVRKFYRRYVQRGTWIGNFSDIKFFQAMQPDGLKYRLLGAVKCIFPRFFYWLKANLRRESGV